VTTDEELFEEAVKVFDDKYPYYGCAACERWSAEYRTDARARAAAVRHILTPRHQAKRVAKEVAS